jgi:hypothetical protein
MEMPTIKHIKLHNNISKARTSSICISSQVVLPRATWPLMDSHQISNLLTLIRNIKALPVTGHLWGSCLMVSLLSWITMLVKSAHLTPICKTIFKSQEWMWTCRLNTEWLLDEAKTLECNQIKYLKWESARISQIRTLTIIISIRRLLLIETAMELFNMELSKWGHTLIRPKMWELGQITCLIHSTLYSTNSKTRK